MMLFMYYLEPCGLLEFWLATSSIRHAPGVLHIAPIYELQQEFFCSYVKMGRPWVSHLFATPSILQSSPLGIFNSQQIL
jgi:hypothetical protein